MSVITTRTEGSILEVTLDRPKANAIDLATSRLMGETFRAFRDDPALRVAIVRTAGRRSRPTSRGRITRLSASPTK